MVEIRASFGSLDEWEKWRDEFGPSAPYRLRILEDVHQRGLVEPLTGTRRHPYQIRIDESNLHETILAAELNSRMRALLVRFQLELRVKGWLGRRDLRVLGTEGLSRMALIFRGLFPFYLGTEYLPTPEAKRNFFPVRHVDLQTIDLEDNTFDAFVSADVFEHIPDLDKALREILRVLKPGGLLVASFPFEPSRIETEVRSTIAADGSIVYHMPAKRHGNPADPAGGSLVFQYPGWDLLPKLREWGCSDAYYSTLASSYFGVASEGKPGPFILTAKKAEGDGSAPPRPGNFVARKSIPDKICTMVALPRSGTTLLTSMFSVHSKVEAVYEPWNSKVLNDETDADAQLSVVAAKGNLPDLSGKILFIKETAVRPRYINYMQKLHDTAPFPVEKHAIVLLRDPDHTLMSEIDRRNEWWDGQGRIDESYLKVWCGERGLSLWRMLRFGMAANAMAIAFEEVAARPEQVMGELAARIGFCLEREQLEYEKHVDSSRVRGDQNVAASPQKIDLSRAVSRGEKVAVLVGIVSDTPYANWFAAFRSLHNHVKNCGGIVSFASIPKPLIEALRRPD